MTEMPADCAPASDPPFRRERSGESQPAAAALTPFPGTRRAATSSGRRRKGPLPGDLTPKALVERFIRVDHAGELGAVRIYQGQMAVLGDKHPLAAEIRHMAAQERVHKETFDKLVAERRVRPTALTPLWHVAGFMLGAGTALLGVKGAMACTAAVEETIDAHYAAQAEALAEMPQERDLLGIVEQYRAEEIEHRDIGLAHGAEEAPGWPVLRRAIRAGSRVAIFLSERV